MTKTRDQEGKPNVVNGQQQRTELRFVGQIAGVKIASPKASTNNYYGASIDGGHLEVIFKIERPKAPRKPQPHYLLGRPRPAPFAKPQPKAKKGDAEGALDQRMAQWEKDRQARQKEIDTYDQHAAKHVEALAAFEVTAREYGMQLMQYSNIVGIAAALGDVKCEVAIAPAIQDMLPGFTMSANLLDTPGPDAAENDDGADFDEDDEDDDAIDDSDEDED